jgi:phage terminase large subunit-like protein
MTYWTERLLANMAGCSNGKERALSYIDKVKSGDFLVCKWTEKFVQRHLNDLRTAADRGFYFDEAAGERILRFFSILHHSKGEWAGKPVVLEEWQSFLLYCLFGWKKDDGFRRFRVSYLEISRKNGKSLIASGIGLYLLLADNESGAEIYSAATHRAQARITHSEAIRMVKASPYLRSKVKIFKDNLHIVNTASKFEPLGKDSDTRNWVKANPNIGVSVYWDDIRAQAKRAEMLPSALNSFLRLRLNQWTQSESRWISIETWESCDKPFDIQSLRGRKCYGGLDLSSNLDISAFVLVFPPLFEDDDFIVLCRFWIPEENILKRVQRDRVPYDVWTSQKFITATSGNVVDYDFILDQVVKDSTQFELVEVAFDRWGANQLVQKLMESGINVVQMGQGFASMSSPMKELERLLTGGLINHLGNPVLSWMASNLVARVDPAGNIKPDKEKSIEKIDGIVALIMALDRAVRNHDGNGSVYEERGILCA